MRSGAPDGSADGDDLATFVQKAVAVTVGTRGGDLRPAVTRGWAPVVSAGGAVVELSVAAPAGTRVRRNLEANGEIAVTFSVPSSYVTTQVKGRVTAMAQPSPEQLGRIDEHVAAFAAAVAPFGLTPEFVRALACGEMTAVTITTGERFDQTPGRGAGRAL